MSRAELQRLQDTRISSLTWCALGTMSLKMAGWKVPVQRLTGLTRSAHWDYLHISLAVSGTRDTQGYFWLEACNNSFEILCCCPC